MRKFGQTGVSGKAVTGIESLAPGANRWQIGVIPLAVRLVILSFGRESLPVGQVANSRTVLNGFRKENSRFFPDALGF